MQSRLKLLIAINFWCICACFVGAEDQQIDRLLHTFVEELILITPGEGRFPPAFQMGDNEGPQEERRRHVIVMTKPFSMAKYEVTQNFYETVMGNNPSRWKGTRNSVEMISWNDAREFCTKATELLRSRKQIFDDEVIRLPTEAEWEYCCRAGTTSRYSFGDDPQQPGEVSPKASILDQYAWHAGNAAGNDPPVGALKPNPWGFYDMHGYLWEFTADSWNPSPEDGPMAGVPKEMVADLKDILIRGGSWKDRYNQLSSSARRKFARTAKDDAVGFRCVKSKQSD